VTEHDLAEPRPRPEIRQGTPHQVDVFAGRGEIADERDPTSIREGVCRLSERSGAADLHHEFDTAAASEPPNFGTPGRCIDVVHDVPETEFAEASGFLGARRGRDDAGSDRDCELCGKDGDTARTLNERSLVTMASRQAPGAAIIK
jgi:hypothetical protein